jgi:hypothetical protein
MHLLWTFYTLMHPAWLRCSRLNSLRVRAKINLQILSVEAPAGQGAKVQEYRAYSELSQHRQAGCIGA